MGKIPGFRLKAMFAMVGASRNKQRNSYTDPIRNVIIFNFSIMHDVNSFPVYYILSLILKQGRNPRKSNSGPNQTAILIVSLVFFRFSLFNIDIIENLVGNVVTTVSDFFNVVDHIRIYNGKFRGTLSSIKTFHMLES